MLITVLSVCLCLQVFIGATGNGKKNFTRLVLNKGNKSFSFYQGEFNTFGWAGDSVRNVSKWIKQNIPVDSKILCQHEYLRSIDFFTDNQYDLIEIKTLKSTNLRVKGDSLALYMGDKESILALNLKDKKKGLKLRLSPKEDIQSLNSKDKVDLLTFEHLGRPLFITPLYKFNKKRMRGNGFRVLFENILLQTIEKSNAQYIIVTYRRNYLTRYLDESNAFELERSFSNGKIKIYKVKDSFAHKTPEGYPVFDVTTYKVLNQLCMNSPNKLQREKNILGSILNWNPLALKRLFSAFVEGDEQSFCEIYGCFKERRIY
jgi:hypothetical protein